MQPLISYRDRKYRATTQKMSITYFKLQDNPNDFRVGVIGSRKIPYILDFSVSTLNVTCTCPDFQNRESKPICKHMLFIISLSNQKSIFNNLSLHIELKNETIISLIRTSLIAIIDKKKLNSELDESNTVSIERDDFCSICMCDLDNKIEKCSVCSHVMHIQCVTGWWELSSRWNLNKGKCPYCKDPRGFSHIKYMDDDPWKNFDFSIEAQAPGAPAPEASQPLEAPAPEAAQPLESLNDQLIIETQNHSFFNLFQQMRILLEHINIMRNSNITNPEIQNLESNLQSLNDEHNIIQNAFESQREQS